MLRYSVDEVNSDRVVGWAWDPPSSPEVTVLVDGSPVGTARSGGYRPDVAAALGDPAADVSGFELRFRPDHLTAGHARQAKVVVRIGDTDQAPVLVPVVVAAPDRDLAPGPFPPAVHELLARYDPAYAAPVWDDELVDRAVADLRLLVERGPRAVPALHHHLLLLGQLWMRAAFIERRFPRENAGADLADKDRSCIQNSAVEVFAVASHVATLHAHGVPGSFLEFGCFKGFSTSLFSDVCHQLGVRLHVFDSFAGLPVSESAYYDEGDFAGSRPEVEANIAAYGRPQSVEYHEGFFSDTLPGFDAAEIMAVSMDVDLELSSRDAMTVLPRLDPRGVVFSHECTPELFAGGLARAPRGPDSVVPPIVDAFGAAGRRITGRHVHGHTGAFWDADRGIPPLPTPALLALRDLALEL